MPRGDRTGPEGMGPMTGRGMGNCAGYPARGIGRRGGFYRMGMAFRHGWRRWGRLGWNWEPEIDPVEEKDWLQQEESYLKKQLDEVQNRIAKLSESPE